VVSVTLILLFGGGRTTPKGHEGGSATPKPVMGWLEPLLFLSFFLFQNVLLFNFLKSFLFLIIHRDIVDFLRHVTWTFINF
jgi:hypothetical protein